MRYYLPLVLSLFVWVQSYSQGKFVLKDRAASHKIKFDLINNLIVFPVEVNGVELSFLLDTGVSKPIIFNSLQGIDTLRVNDTEKIFLRGLGSGQPIEAIKSRKNLFKIGDAMNVNQTLFVIFDVSMDFAPRLGVPIHGIIGYDLFKDFVVEVNYTSKYMKLYDPVRYKEKMCKKCEKMDLEFYNSKPYLTAELEENGSRTNIKLLIDSGGSDALWLFEDMEKGIGPKGDHYFEDFLGSGLSGSIYGKRSKIGRLNLKSFSFDNVNVAYPDSSSIHYARKFVDRNGSISAELLKRFNLIFNYGNRSLILRKNANFNNPFNYNKSGISLEYGDVRLVKERGWNRFNDKKSADNAAVIVVTTFKYSFKPAFTIAQLRRNSPAHRAGLQLGDVILTINNRESYEFTLQEMLQHFYGKNGKKIKLRIDRDGNIMIFEFKLESLL